MDLPANVRVTGAVYFNFDRLFNSVDAIDWTVISTAQYMKIFTPATDIP